MNPQVMQPVGPPVVNPAPPPSMWDNPAFFAGVLIFLGLMLLLFGLFASITAAQAKRRGYLFVPWLFAGMLGNPIFLLVMLGVMPDFRRKRMRQKETEDLKRRLARGAARPEPAPVARVKAERRIDRSLGDEVTQDVPERSMGDEETRL